MNLASGRRLLILGGGRLSSRIAEQNTPYFSVQVISLRSFFDASLAERNNMLQRSLGATDIYYLAYHHRKLSLNLRFLAAFLLFLIRNSWQGRFVFFNSQETLYRRYFRANPKQSILYHLNVYRLVKSIQSLALRRAISSFQIIDLYIPRVLGLGSGIDEDAKQWICHDRVLLPNGGNNILAFIEANTLIRWLSELPIRHSNYARGLYWKVFVYQGEVSYSDFLSSLSRSKGLRTPIILDCKNTEPSLAQLRREMISRISDSPLGLITRILYGEFKTFKEMSSKDNSVVKATETTVFEPVSGAKRELSWSFDATKIPFLQHVHNEEN